MDEVDAVLDRVRDELAARDALIAELRAGAGPSGEERTGAHASVTSEEPEAGPWPS
jgi:hypothetical protein